MREWVVHKTVPLGRARGVLRSRRVLPIVQLPRTPAGRLPHAEPQITRCPQIDGLHLTSFSDSFTLEDRHEYGEIRAFCPTSSLHTQPSDAIKMPQSGTELPQPLS